MSTQLKLTQAHTLHQKGQLVQAKTICEELLATEPNDVDAIHLLGVMAYQVGNFIKALELFNRAISLHPTKPMFYSNRGKILQELKQFNKAIENYDYAITLKPDFAAAYFNRGGALQAIKQLTAAIQSYDRAIELKPDFSDAYFSRGNTFLALNQTQTAIENYDKALTFMPDNINIYINRGFALQQLKQLEAAITDFDHVINVCDKTAMSNEDKAKVHVNRGCALLELKRWEEAMQCYDRAIAIKPDYVEAYYNKALVLLSMNNFEKGWDLYEWRSKLKKTNYHPIKIATAWDGKKIAGSLLVLSEQGLGDEIFYSNTLNDLQGMADSITIHLDPRLIPLYQRSFAQFNFVSKKLPVNVQNYDAQIYIGSLGRFFRTSKKMVLDNIKSPYLKADLTQTKLLKERLSTGKKLIFGLSWISKNVESGLEKSLSLRELTSIFALDDIEFVDLQYGDTHEEQAAFFNETNIKLKQVSEVDKFHDIDGLAALISACDVILTISNTTAHLAGALGKKVIIVLPYARGLFWYWHDGSGDSIWYPTATVIRQHKEGDWESVLAKVKHIVEAVRREKA